MKKKQFLKNRQKWNLQIVFNIIVIISVVALGIEHWMLFKEVCLW